MDRAQKHAFVAEMTKTLDECGVVVVAHYAGMSVANMQDLRQQMKQAGGTVVVAKNRLVKLAIKDTEKEGLSDILVGQSVYAYSEDPVTAAKVMVEYAKKNNKLVIRGGAMGSTILDENGVKSLASMPSLDELRGKIVGLVAAPATKVAQVLQAPAGQLARVFAAYGDKEDAA